MAPATVGAPPPTTARTGRERQRFNDDGGRLVAGTIPLRLPAAGTPLTAATVSVLLVTSRSGKGLVFPKGGWETDETLEAAAARETVEEAGVRGELEHPPLGPFACGATKPGRGEAHAHMFAMRVREELATWPEGGQRARVWLPLAAALAAARHEWMRDALRAWADRAGLGGVEADEAAAATAVAETLRRHGVGGAAATGRP